MRNLAIPKPQYKVTKGILKGLDPHESRKKIRAELDKAFSLYIRKRGNWKCEITGGCSHGGAIQCGHKITRGNERLRWDIRNAITTCAGHNKWASHHPIEWRDLYRKLWPEDNEYLDQTQHQTKGYSLIELQILLKHFTKLIKSK